MSSMPGWNSGESLGQWCQAMQPPEWHLSVVGLGMSICQTADIGTINVLFRHGKHQGGDGEACQCISLTIAIAVF